MCQPAGEALNAKPTGVAEGAVTMSQAAAQVGQIKKGGEDSLSPFTSDDEAKPRKYAVKSDY